MLQFFGLQKVGQDRSIERTEIVYIYPYFSSALKSIWCTDSCMSLMSVSLHRLNILQEFFFFFFCHILLCPQYLKQISAYQSLTHTHGVVLELSCDGSQDSICQTSLPNSQFYSITSITWNWSRGSISSTHISKHHKSRLSFWNLLLNIYYSIYIWQRAWKGNKIPFYNYSSINSITKDLKWRKCIWKEAFFFL